MSCCDGSGVTSSPGTTLLLRGYSLQLPGSASAARSFHLYSESQGFAITLFLLSCHENAVSGAMGLQRVPQNCALMHPAVLLLFGQAKLKVFPPSSSCLMTAIFAVHHTLLYNPMITIIHSSSFEAMYHPLTQKKRKTWQKYLNYAWFVCLAHFS